MDKDSSNQSSESENKMESDPSQGSSPPFCSSPITKNENLKLVERLEIIHQWTENVIAENFELKELDKINKKKFSIQAETITALKAVTAILQDKNAQMQTTLAEKQKIINQQTDDAEKQITKIAQLKESKEKLQSENIGLKEEDKTNKEKLSLQRETIDTLQDEISNLIKSNEKLQTENIQLNGDNASLQKSVDTTEKEKVEYESKISQLKESYEKVQAENIGLKDADKTNKEKLSLQEETIHTLQAKGVQLKESLEKLQAENIQLKNVIASFQKSLETTVKEKAECESKISQLTENMDKIEAQRQAEINRLNDQIASLQTTLGTSVASNSQLQQELFKKNDALNAKVCEKSVKIQKLETEIHQNQNDDLTKDNALFIDAGVNCKIEDVVVNGKIDYGKLNGKTLIVDKLEQKRDGKWYADYYEIFFENQNFKVFVKDDLYIISDFDTVFKYVRVNRLNSLLIQDSKILYSDFKKFIASINNICVLVLRYLIVKDENGKIIEIDQLLKGISETNCNIKQIFYIFNHFEVPSKNVFAQLPSLPNIREFCFWDIRDGFDLMDFGELIKKNPNAKYKLKFLCSTKFYAQIKNIEKELRLTLPSTCKLEISKAY